MPAPPLRVLTCCRLSLGRNYHFGGLKSPPGRCVLPPPLSPSSPALFLASLVCLLCPSSAARRSLTREEFPLRSGERTRGNVLFYNLDTPDLVGNKYPHSSRGCCVCWSAGLCWPRTAPAGTTRLRRGVKCSGGCTGCCSIRRQKDSPVFLVFLPSLPPGARVRCQMGDSGGPGAGMGWFAVLWGLQRDLSSPGMQQLEQSSSMCHDPAPAPPDGEALALTPSCAPFPGPRWVLRVLGVML